jgi:hypothetical protein
MVDALVTGTALWVVRVAILGITLVALFVVPLTARSVIRKRTVERRDDASR